MPHVRQWAYRLMIPSEPPPSVPPPDDEAIPSGRWAFGLGVALVLILGAVAGFTTWDHWHEGDLEKVETPTAVGDTHYGKMPAKKGDPIGLKYQGQPLAMISEGKSHDARLLQVATDDSGYYWLYRAEEVKKRSKEDPAELPPGHFYLKLAPDDYMEVAPQ